MVTTMTTGYPRNAQVFLAYYIAIVPVPAYSLSHPLPTYALT